MTKRFDDKKPVADFATAGAVCVYCAGPEHQDIREWCIGMYRQQLTACQKELAEAKKQLDSDWKFQEIVKVRKELAAANEYIRCAIIITPEEEQERQRLKAELAELKDSYFERFLQWRGVEKACKKCNGTGRLAYADTSAWHHCIGGQSITWDVCEYCWGSGDKSKQGANLRTLSGLAKELSEAKNVLKDLYDLQNGPPLLQHKDEWLMVMAKASALIKDEK